MLLLMSAPADTSYPLPNSTMAAGSRDVYALNLNDIFAFPDGDNIPLRPPNTEGGESWVMLLEVRRSVVRGFKRYTLTLW